MTLLRDITFSIVADTSFDEGVTRSMVTDVVPDDPNGYTIAWDTDPVNSSNVEEAGIVLTGGLEGDTYQYIITSTGGGVSVSDTGTLVGESPYTFDDIDVSGLEDGTLTAAITIERDGVIAAPAYATVLKDTVAPDGYTVDWVSTVINLDNEEDASFEISGCEIGATYTYLITSSGGVTEVEGDGVVTDSTMLITGVDVSSLDDGDLSITVKLTDPAGNEGDPVDTGDATIVKDTVVPSGYSVEWTTDPINAENEGEAAFNLLGGEVGATYYYAITSDGEGGQGLEITDSGTITDDISQAITDIDVTGLPDGTLTLTLTVTDESGNVGEPVEDTVVKDTVD
jgi:hypothetical protein